MTLPRRTFLAASIGYALAVVHRVQAESEQRAARWITEATQTGIERGLKWLGARVKDDGSFSGGGYGRNVAVAALAGMALLSAGSTPGRGSHGAALERLQTFTLASSQENGFICQAGAASHGPMYEHGFATLFLAEIYGMSPEEELRDKLSRAVRLIVASQNKEGGWRYEPRPADADVSVTICQIMALRAAKNAGLHVPNETVERCVEYVKRCQNADGGFMYMAAGGGPSRFPRSAAGLVALYSAGIYEGDEIQRGLEYLLKHLPKAENQILDPHEMYGQYYAVQAMWHAGGKYWDEWYPAIRDLLLAKQRPDGSWNDPVSSEYGTAMACIVLQMPNNYLPIFQR